MFTLKKKKKSELSLFLQNSPPARSTGAEQISPKHAASKVSVGGRGPRAWGRPFKTQRGIVSSGPGTVARGCGGSPPPGASAPGSGRPPSPRSHGHLSARRTSGRGRRAPLPGWAGTPAPPPAEELAFAPLRSPLRPSAQSAHASSPPGSQPSEASRSALRGSHAGFPGLTCAGRPEEAAGGCRSGAGGQRAGFCGGAGGRGGAGQPRPGPPPGPTPS